MKTLDLLKNVKTITNTKAIKGGSDTIQVSVTSIDINSDLTITEDFTKDITKEISVKGN